ncbi:Nvj2p [Rhodotorula paludigena]|uniref:Nvj2p n=1 Tax=Rhodotorula paludigena TaxID=86838 RepID=UPI00317E4F9A
MGSFGAFVLTYVLGGITFVPLCLAVVLAVIFYTSPVVQLPRKTGIPKLPDQPDDAEPVSVYRAGWLTVRRTYEPLKDAGDGTYAGMIRTFMDNRSRDPRRTKPKDRFFAVLKQSVLFLYEGEDQAECWAAIEISAHDVVIYPEEYIDGELFVKRTAIELKPRSSRIAASDDDNERPPESPALGQAKSEDLLYDTETGKPLPWFIFAKVNSDKEDWYHSLILSSRLGSPTSAADIAKDRALFEPEDMARLIESIDQQPDSIPMRWLNALLGRIFLSAYRTCSLEDYITSRIVRKLKRVKLPTMLSEIQVREVNVGASVPLFSKPMLKELTADGDASMEVHVAYVGGARVTIQTEATVSLGSRFKPYSVRLVLAVVLKELEGTLLVKIKKPPSNRVWFGFTSQPKMVLAVEPVVSARQIKWSLVTGPIESRIRELIMESIVVPHMDDLAFFDTRSIPLSRGGIYGPFLRRERPSKEEELIGPKKEDREVKPGDPSTVKEDELVAPSPAPPDGEGATGVSTATSNGDTRFRPSTRRRRSSEGDAALDSAFTPLVAANSTRHAPPPQSQSAATGATTGISRSASTASSSVSSLANGLQASLASWREKNASSSSFGSASTPPGTSAGGTQPRRKTSWFSKSSSSTAPSVRSASVLTADSSDSLASAASASSATTETGGAGGGGTGAGGEEISASRLREILQQRAESRERERAAQEQADEAKRGETLLEADEVDDEPPVVPDKTEAEKVVAFEEVPPQQSNLSRTAPAKDDSASASADAESPLVLNEAAASLPAPEAAVVPPTPASPSRPPPLPNRPSFVKTQPTPPPASPSSSVPPAPSPLLSTETAFSSTRGPAPPPRRHSPSASVDSPNPATSTSSILSSWRTTRASLADKDALAAGVASAKESMRRWGANWAASRAAASSSSSPAGGTKTRVEDLDRPVGDSPLKAPNEEDERGAESYRDYRRRAASPTRTGGGASRPIEVVRTPPRGGAGAGGAGGHFSPASSSLPSTALSPSHALSSSPSSAAAGAGPARPTVTQPPGAAGMGGYRPAQMMTLPGIRDEARRQRVREDHLGGGVSAPAGGSAESGEGAGKVEKKAQEKEQEKAQEEASATVEPSKLPPLSAPSGAVTADVAVAPPSPQDTPPLLPAPSPSTDVAAAPSTSSSSAPSTPPPASQAPALPPRQLDPPALLPRLTASPKPDAPPALPPRKTDEGNSEVETQAATNGVDGPPLPPRKTEEIEGEDNLADEAGWGLEEVADEDEKAAKP